MFVTGKTGNNQNVFTRELVEQTMWDPHADAKSLQSCPTLCDLIDGNPPGSVIPGILQARTLEWVAISFSNAWKWKVKVKSLSRVRLPGTPWTAAHQAPPPMGFSRQEHWSGVPSPSPHNGLQCIFFKKEHEVSLYTPTKWSPGYSENSSKMEKVRIVHRHSSEARRHIDVCMYLFMLKKWKGKSNQTNT